MKKMMQVVGIGLGLISISAPVCARKQIDITVEILNQDSDALKKYIIEGIAPNIIGAKKVGRTVVHFAAGISYYAFDSIPWHFFEDIEGIRGAFERIYDEMCAQYIQEGKEEYKRTIQRKKPRISRSKLGEYLHKRLIASLNISDEHKNILHNEPIKTDEFMQQGMMNKDDYMYYNLLNLITQYYLEKEFGKHR